MEFSRWKINICKMKGLIVHPIEWERLCEILKVPKGFPKFLKFILDSWANGGGDFIQREGF